MFVSNVHILKAELPILLQTLFVSKITEVIFGDQGTIKDATYISNARQVSKLNEALNSLNEAIEKCYVHEYVDIIDIYIREAYLSLGEIIGDGSVDSLIDELFSKFCLGK